MTTQKPDQPQLDEKDRQILAELGKDAWLKYTELGRRVNLSASAAQRRVERLVETGVIVGTKALTALGRDDRPVRLFVLVELRDDGISQLNEFSKKMAGADAVSEAHYVTGETDLLLVLQVKDMSEYVAFVDTYLNSDPNVRRSHSLFALRPLKSQAN